MIIKITPRLAPGQARLLRRRLSDAQNAHDAIRLNLRRGVSVEALASDHRRWEQIGDAIAGLADLVSRHCAASAFCDSRPDVAALTFRLSESIDDLVEAPVWSVIDAAARLAAATFHE